MSYCFPLTLIRRASLPSEERVTEKVNSDEGERRQRYAVEDRAGCEHHTWGLFSALEGPASKEKGRGSGSMATFFQQTDCGLRDESANARVFVKNTDSQASV